MTHLELGGLPNAALSNRPSDDANSIINQWRYASMTKDLTREEYIAAARSRYCDDDVYIEEDPSTSSGEGGCWVAAWVWVPHDNL